MFSSVAASIWKAISSLSVVSSLSRSNNKARVLASSHTSLFFIALQRLFRHGENVHHHIAQPPPVMNVGLPLLLSRLRNAVISGPPVILRGAPGCGDPSSLLQPNQRRIDRSLVQQHSVPTHLLDPARDSVTVHPSHRSERLQHHQVERALQQLELVLLHTVLLRSCGNTT